MSRYIYFRFKGEIPENICICHKCDNRQCINPDHFFLSTKKNNTEEKMETYYLGG